MSEFIEWRSNPQNLTVLGYIDGLTRAIDQAGLTLTKAHIATIKQLIERDYGLDAVKPEVLVRPANASLDSNG